MNNLAKSNRPIYLGILYRIRDGAKFQNILQSLVSIAVKRKGKKMYRRFRKASIYMCTIVVCGIKWRSFKDDGCWAANRSLLHTILRANLDWWKPSVIHGPLTYRTCPILWYSSSSSS